MLEEDLNDMSGTEIMKLLSKKDIKDFTLKELNTGFVNYLDSRLWNKSFGEHLIIRTILLPVYKINYRRAKRRLER